jgi:hypothetical protein
MQAHVGIGKELPLPIEHADAVGAMRDDASIAVRKVRSYLVSAEQISDRDIEEKFKKDNTKVDVVYATIDLEKIRKSGYKPTEQELQAAIFQRLKPPQGATQGVCRNGRPNRHDGDFGELRGSHTGDCLFIGRYPVIDVVRGGTIACCSTTIACSIASRDCTRRRSS